MLKKLILGFKGGGVPLLLDQFPGSTHAYSLRKLNSAYAGACIRVRRSNDNTEMDIGFVAEVIDLSTLQTFVGANSGFIRTWYDQSGNNNNLNQTTGTRQPAIINTGNLNLDNSKPVLNFNGGQFLNVPAVLNTFGISWIVTNGVKNLNSPTNYFGRYFGNNPVGDLYFGGNNYSMRFSDGGTGFIYTTDNFPFENQQTIISFNQTNIFFNGVSKITQGAFTTQNSLVPVIGNQFAAYYSGGIQEIIIWDNNLIANRTTIEANINDYYNTY